MSETETTSLLDRAKEDAPPATEETEVTTPPGDDQPKRFWKDRPDWLPEQFYDDKAGSARIEQMAKSYTDLRNELNGVRQKGGVPEEVAGYLEGWEPPKSEDGGELKRTKPIAADDPALTAVAEAAHAVGMSKKQFDGFVRRVAVAFDGLMPEPVDQAQEIAALGGEERAAQTLGIISQWAQRMTTTGQWNGAEAQEFRRWTQTAAGVSLAAKLMQATGEKPIPVTLRHADSKSEAELQAMQQDPRYKTDPAFRATVMKEYERRYGNAPTDDRSSFSPVFTD